MATQPRQWFRLPSIGRPAPLVTPTPEPPAPQPRPPMFRAPFRPMGQPQPQESTQAPAPSGVSSVPTSPIRRTSVPSSPVPRRSPSPPTLPATTSPPKPQVSAPSSPPPASPTKPPSTSSMPTSPPKPAPTTSPPKPVATTFSLPTSPPKPSPTTSPPKPVATTFSLPTSPPKPAPTTFYVPTTSPPKPAPTSPPKPAPTTFSVPTISPPKPAPTTFSVPTTSPPKPVPTTFSVPRSPAKPEPAVTAATSAATTTARLPSPTPVGPRTLLSETPPQSPYKKATAPPPSPLILPPPQFTSKAETQPTIPAETEQKTVLVQTSSEKPKSWFNGTGNHFDEAHKPSSYAHRGNHEVHKEVAKNAKVHRKQFSSDSDEVGMRVITIAGENKGAFMEVIKSPLKHRFDGNTYTLHNKESLKTQSDGTGWHSFSSSSDEEKSKKDKNLKAKAGMLSPPMGAFMNSNVQGVNNSIVLHSSCSHHDPGVHLSLSRKPSGNGFHVKDKSNGHHS